MTKEEYEKKYLDNTKITGHGFDTTVHMPCPACAEPDFLSYPVLLVEKAMQDGSSCVHCGFAMKCIVYRDQHGVQMEMVQTAGGDLPNFLPAMRRESDA